MARPRSRIVLCRDCGTEIVEPPPRSGLLSAERVACANCGSTAREYRLGLADELGTGDVTIQASPARATAAATPGNVSIENAVSTGIFTRTVVWSKNPDAWLAEVRDADGSLVGLEINFDAMDTLVLLAEHLLPPFE